MQYLRVCVRRGGDFCRGRTCKWTLLRRYFRGGKTVRGGRLVLAWGNAARVCGI